MIKIKIQKQTKKQTQKTKKQRGKQARLDRKIHKILNSFQNVGQKYINNSQLVVTEKKIIKQVNTKRTV